MATAKTVPVTKRAKRNANIRTSKPNTEATKPLSLPALTRIDADYVDATRGNKSGFATFNLRVGDATYRAITFGIIADAAIPDVTIEYDGIHYVALEHLPDYIGTVQIVPNGKRLQWRGLDELIVRNTLKGISWGPVYAGFAFPGEFTYSSTRMNDAFALGTKDFRSLSFEAELKDDFDEDTMEIVVMPHVVDRVKPTGFTFADERLNATFTGSGKHTYYDLPMGDDIAELMILGEGIRSVKLTIDGDVLYDMDRAQYEAYLISMRKSPEVLEGKWLIDIHAERDPRSIAALDRKGERSRGARAKLEIYCTNASTPVEFVLTNADLYANVR